MPSLLIAVGDAAVIVSVCAVSLVVVYAIHRNRTIRGKISVPDGEVEGEVGGEDCP